MNDQWLMPIILLAKKAGEEILKQAAHLKRDSSAISYKEDKTIVTMADLAAHEVIQKGLYDLTPHIPLLSEEGVIPPWEIRSQWKYYWLIDPLDGTRGFVENGADFTVNIALIKGNKPIMGVVYVPLQGECYFACHGQPAFKQLGEAQPEPIHTRKIDWKSLSVFLGCYRHSPELLALFKSISHGEIIRLNSSLKFCRIAEGKGDLYLQFHKISEWDTAAAQCILESAGGGVVDLNGRALQYNTKDSLISYPFIAIGDLTQKIRMIERVRAVDISLKRGGSR